MKLALMTLLVAAMTACSTTKNTGPEPIMPPSGDEYHVETDSFIGHPAIEAPVREQMRALLTLIEGADPSEADTMKFVGNRLEPTGRNRDGFHGDLPQGTNFVGVHGANSGTATNQSGSIRLGWSEFWLAFPEDGSPDGWTVRHEAMHQVGNCCCSFGGHPESFDCNGRRYIVQDVLGAGIRWPAQLWNAVRHPVAVWDNSGYKCRHGGDWGDSDDAKDD